MLLSDIVPEDTVCFTGHRPKELSSFDIDSIKAELRVQILAAIAMGKNTFISGMALGVDIWAAIEVLKLRKTEFPHIKLVAAIPCHNQWKPWRNHPESVELWRKVKSKADLAFYVTESEYTDACMHVRNHWMVDHSSLVIAVYTGSDKGGTAACMKYATRMKRESIIINPSKYLILDLDPKSYPY